MNDPVAKYLPEFAQNGKEDITVRQLLTHYSGLEPDLDLKTPWEGKETAYQMAFAETPAHSSGIELRLQRHQFHRAGRAGRASLGRDARCLLRAKHIFAPLKMTHTRFVPPAAWRAKIAPTQYDENEHMLRGVVHDPTARRMGGVAGHAGLFSTGDDLAKFAQALLNGGGGILSPLAVEKMTHAAAASCGAGAARLWLGHRFSVFVESRRFAARRIVWAHRIHRDFVVDRSHHADLHHFADECGASAREGKCDWAAVESCDCSGGGAYPDSRARRKSCAGRALPDTTRR